MMMPWGCVVVLLQQLLLHVDHALRDWVMVWAAVLKHVSLALHGFSESNDFKEYNKDLN